MWLALGVGTVMALLALVAWLLYDIRHSVRVTASSIEALTATADLNLARVVEELRVAHEKLAGLELTKLIADQLVIGQDYKQLRADLDELAAVMRPYIK